jgi:hypothetical protein
MLRIASRGPDASNLSTTPTIPSQTLPDDKNMTSSEDIITAHRRPIPLQRQMILRGRGRAIHGHGTTLRTRMAELPPAAAKRQKTHSSATPLRR